MEGAARAAGLTPGTQLGRYTLLRRLAVGGMAELYIAQQSGAAGFAKIVALKRILPHLAEDPTFTNMFLDEARLASGLNHPNLAHVLDFGEYDGEHFLTMEYVHGRNLLQLLRAAAAQTLPLACALAICTRVARGLHDLHEQRSPDGRPMGLVHRDVSPSNVLVSFDGEVKLTDFGIAKAMELTSATRSGTFKGKLGHSSPEQARGEEIDRRSDVFCLGILVYEATTGARAFSGANEFAVLGKVARGDYVPPQEVSPDYPPALAAIVARALRVEPQERYASALEVAEDLEVFGREADVLLTTEAVAGSMRALFGPAPPVVAQAELSLASRPAMTVSADEPPTNPSLVLAPKRNLGLMIAVPLALLVGAAGAWLAGAAGREAPPTEGNAPAERAPPSQPAAAVVAPAPVPTPQDSTPVTTPAATPSESPPDAAPTPQPEPQAQAHPTDPVPAERPGRGRRSKKNKLKKKKATTPASDLDGLYPPGT